MLFAWFCTVLEKRPNLITRIALDEGLYDAITSALESANPALMESSLVPLKAAWDQLPHPVRVTLPDHIPPAEPGREQHISDCVRALDEFRKAKQAVDTMASAPQPDPHPAADPNKPIP